MSVEVSAWRRNVLSLAAPLLLVALVRPAAAQNPIQWSSNPKSSIAQAQRTLLPLLFYVPLDRESRQGLVSFNQDATLRDPLINALVYERFVPVRLERSSDSLDFLARAGAPTGYGGFLLVTSPTGESLGVIGITETADPTSLANALTAKFRAYRDQLYKEQFKPVLEDKAAKPPALLHALLIIRQLIITSAEKDIEKLAERPGLSREIHASIYDTQAVLSTPESTTALFDAALVDRRAAQALKRSTPAAAGRLLKELKLDNDPKRFVLAYDAVTAITRIPGAKPEGFWKGPNEHIKEQEVDRVKDLAERIVADWEQRPAAVLR